MWGYMTERVAARFLVCLFLIGLLTASGSALAAIFAADDAIQLTTARSATIDLLANDVDDAGRQVWVTLHAPSPASLGVIDYGDGTIGISIPASAPANGNAQFTYTAGDGLDSQDATVYVCWGSDPCLFHEGPPEVVPCQQLCVTYADTDYGSGATIDLGSSNAWTTLDFSVVVSNNLAAAVSLQGALAGGDSRALTLLQNGTPTSTVQLNIPAGGSLTLQMRETFLPGTPAPRNLVLTSTSAPPTTGSPWTFGFRATGTGATCASLCIVFSGQESLPNSDLDLGTQAAGAVRDYVVTIENGLGRSVTLSGVMSGGDARAVKLTENGSVVSSITRNIASGAQATVSLHAVFLPGTFSGNTLTLTDTANPGSGGSPWKFLFHGTGSGQITVPGYTDCPLGDACLYVAGTKLTTLNSGPVNPTKNLCNVSGFSCPVPVGDSRSIPVVLVYNAVPEDGGGLPLQAISDASIQLLQGGTAFQQGVVGIGQALALTAKVTPQTAGTLTPLLQFRVGLGGQDLGAHLQYTASPVGGSCERCALTVGGITYPNGATVNLGSAPAGTSMTIEGIVHNNASINASFRLLTAGEDNYYFNVDPGDAATITLAPGADRHFHFTVQLKSGPMSAQLQVVDAVLSIPSVTVNLTANGTGTIPPVPGFESCSTSLYLYCLFVGNELAGALPVSASVPPVIPPPAKYAYDFGTLKVNDWSGVPVTIVNNGPNSVAASYFNARGQLRVLSNGQPIPTTAGAPIQSVPPHTAMSVEVQYAWQSPGGHVAQGPGIAHLDVRFEFGFNIPLVFVSNCAASTGCLFGDDAPGFGIPHGQVGYAGHPADVQFHKFGFFNRSSTTSSYRFRFANFVDLAHAPAGPTPFRFEDSASDTVGPLSIPRNRYWEGDVRITFPSVASTSAAALYVGQVSSGGAVSEQIGDYVRVTAGAATSSFPDCASVCVYTNQPESSLSPFNLTAPANHVLSMQQYLTPLYTTTLDLGQSFESSSGVLANATSQWQAIDIDISPGDQGFSLHEVVENGVLLSLLHDTVWLPPMSLAPVSIAVRAAQWNTSAQMVFSNATLGKMTYALSNLPPRTNADCRDICMAVNGAKYANGDTVHLPADASALTSARLSVVNGAASARDFVITLSSLDGVILNSGGTFTGDCDPQRSVGLICRGHLEAGAAASVTLTLSTSGAQSVQIHTVMGTSDHILTADYCNGLCMFAGNGAIGSGAVGVDFGRSLVSRDKTLPLIISNNTEAPIHLGTVQLTGPFSSSLAGKDVTIAAHSTLQATLVFHPTAVGAVNGTMGFSAYGSARTLTGQGRARMSLPLGASASPTIRY